VHEIVGFQGTISRDLMRPDGPPGKLMDSSPIAGMGWKPRIGLRGEIAHACADFRDG
jgi:GDP-L-fucose synthase